MRNLDADAAAVQAHRIAVSISLGSAVRPSAIAKLARLASRFRSRTLVINARKILA
jgi:hypothetical protein